MSRVAESGDSTFWAVSGPTRHMAVMTSPTCNVPLGAWYYYVNATGNGGASWTTYIDGYCGGSGCFDGMLGPSAGTHPFFLTLSPAPDAYCR